EVTKRDLDRWPFVPLPVAAQEQASPVALVGRYPQVLYSARSMYVSKCRHRAGFYLDAWRHLPTYAEVARCLGTGSLARHAPFAFFAGEVLGADRACLSLR